MNPKPLIMLITAGMGIVLAGLSIPLILRRVPPNPFYGFRLPKTINNPNIWYEINEHSGWRLLITGAASAILAAGLYFLVPGLSIDTYSLILVAAVVIMLGVGFWQSFRKLSQM